MSYLPTVRVVQSLEELKRITKNVGLWNTPISCLRLVFELILESPVYKQTRWQKNELTGTVLEDKDGSILICEAVYESYNIFMLEQLHIAEFYFRQFAGYVLVFIWDLRSKNFLGSPVLNQPHFSIGPFT